MLKELTFFLPPIHLIVLQPPPFRPSPRKFFEEEQVSGDM